MSNPHRFPSLFRFLSARPRRTIAASVGALVLVTLAACDRGRLEVRTFELSHLGSGEALELIRPYVYTERRNAPGAATTIDGALSVRELPENLERIAAVLAEFDEARRDVELYFQLIEADGFSGSDPRIADVEAELREVFQFQGYRLVAEAFALASDGSELLQRMRAADTMYAITGRVFATTPSSVVLDEITLWDEAGSDQHLRTTVTLQRGQTLVLGASPKPGSSATLLLTVRAEDGAASE